MVDTLTGKQRQFVIEYSRCLNGTEAARLAGYKGDDRTLAVQAYDNLRKPKIRAKIDELLSQRTMSKDEVIARFSSQAESAFGSFIMQDWAGHITLDLKALRAAGLSHLIKKISNSKFGPSIEFHDPQLALSKLAQYYGLLNDSTTINLHVDLKVIHQIEAAAEKAGVNASDLFNNLLAEVHASQQNSEQGVAEDPAARDRA